jgi:acyl carrier protein
VDAIPLTQNGKVDRRALSALRPLEVGRPQVGSTFVAPSTPLEEKLAEIWSGALNIARPGVHDNFFELGGSSLPALQVVSRVSAAFGVDLPVQDFFENPTIAQLGQRIEDLLVAQIDALSEEEAQKLLRNFQ